MTHVAPTNVPAELPPMPADFATNSKARHDHFAATVKAFEAAEGQRPPASPSASADAPAVAQPDEAALRILAETAKHRGADGQPAMFTNAKFRDVVSRLRTDVYAGKPFDRDAAQRAVCEALGIELPLNTAPDKAEPIAEPAQFTDDQLNALAARLDEGFVPVSELPVAALSGYQVELPDGWGLTRDHVQMLSIARAANVPQEVITAYVAEVLKASEAA